MLHQFADALLWGVEVSNSGDYTGFDIGRFWHSNAAGAIFGAISALLYCVLMVLWNR